MGGKHRLGFRSRPVWHDDTSHRWLVALPLRLHFGAFEVGSASAMQAWGRQDITSLARHFSCFYESIRPRLCVNVPSYSNTTPTVVVCPVLNVTVYVRCDGRRVYMCPRCAAT